MATRPFAYQNDGALQIERFRGRALLADQMGLGKSLQALLWARRNPDARPVIVVCPASLKWNWQREAAVHFNMRSEVLGTTKPPRHGLIAHEPILIINYDVLHAWVDYLRALAPQLIVLDEVQAVCNRQARRSKAVRRLCAGVPHLIALSGTPLTNRPAELWPVLNLVRPDLYPRFGAYAEEFCPPERKPWGVVYTGARNLGELHRRLKEDLMIRRLKQDVLKDLPPKRKALVPMDIDDRRQYRQAVQDFIGWLTRLDPGRALRAARAERMVRIGYLKRLVGKLKLTSVTEWVDRFLENEDKLVLFAIHKEVIEHLTTRYKDVCVKVDGSVVGPQRQTAVDRFQKDKRVRLFVGNVNAAGKGITLTAAHALAFAEIGWTPGEMVQAEDRIHRIGQSHAAVCYYLSARDTIEQRILELITEKQRVLDAVLDGGREDAGADVYDRLCDELIRGAKRERQAKRR